MDLQVTYDWEGLRRVCRILRGPGGCNWDRAQTLETLTPYVLEETHEFLEAIGRGDAGEMAEEMGDLLYLLVFMITIAEEESRFDFGDVTRSIIDKMIRRHPHVFGTTRQGLTPAEVSEQWESIKDRERDKHSRGGKPGRLASGARGLPALLDAYRVQEKAASFGFDWTDVSSVLQKLDEERKELDEALARCTGEVRKVTAPADVPARAADAGDRASPRGPKQHGDAREDLTPQITDELGDLLFTLVNLARHLKKDPEQILRQSTQKFQRRFSRMEQILKQSGSTLSDADLDRMESAWQQAKAMDDKEAS
ncbi:MAG: nucleoside triphosphate pyrophosphohydrolase [Candidatus Eisenbacteria sp.]|nr:nucleoside triphosphate pyrophosphohydrolase [Candidatus Eisenbacteria bacterium]